MRTSNIRLPLRGVCCMPVASDVKTQMGKLLFHSSRWFALCVCLSLITTAVKGEETRCDFEQTFKDGGSRGASVDLVLNQGNIVAITIQSFSASGKAAGGYSCYLDSGELGASLAVEVKGAVSVLKIRTKSSDALSTVRVEQSPKGFTMNLEDVSLDYCGFGAEWPRTIFVKRGANKCKVDYR